MHERILLATDGSEHAMTAARHAVDVAQKYGATLHAVYVIETRTAYDNAIVEPEEVRANLERVGEESLAEISTLAEEHGVPLETAIEEGVPGDEILAYVDAEDIDWVFIGERGHSDFKTVLLGSTSERVLHGTAIPVTIV
jgi:nucleotide-binding universal stress UspA family protein